jgi:hypothetical protein
VNEQRGELETTRYDCTRDFEEKGMLSGQAESAPGNCEVMTCPKNQDVRPPGRLNARGAPELKPGLERGDGAAVRLRPLIRRPNAADSHRNGKF